MPDAGAAWALEIFFASVLAELVNKAVLHPIDTLKARLQYQRSESLLTLRRAKVTGSPWWRSMSQWPVVSDIRAAVQLIRAELHPMRALFAGLTPSLVGVVPVSFVYMPTYEISKAYVKGTPLEGTPLPAVLTGVASATVRVPVSVVKARMQLQLHRDFFSCVREAISQKRGFRGLYVGFNAVVILDVTYAAVGFACIEYLRGVAFRSKERVEGRPRNEFSPKDLAASTNAMIGFATGIITSLVTEPIDVIKTRLMAQRTSSGSGPSEGMYFGYRGVGDGLRSAIRQEGVFTLWKGSLPRLVIKAFGSSLWFTLYMFFRQVFPGTAPER